MTAGTRERGASLTSHQLHLLHTAAASFGVPLSCYVERVASLVPGVTGLDDLDVATFDLLMDAFVAAGFRHPAVPIVSPAQLAGLDASRRQLGMAARDFVRLLRLSTGAPSHRLMTGTHVLALAAVFEHHGADVWLPEPGFVDRDRASTLRRTAWRNRVPDGEVRELMMLFDGCTRMRGLDAHAYGRVMMVLYGRGGGAPPRAPRVAAEPGMATQAQVNVLWRAWHEARRGYDASEASLDVAIGLLLHFPGGVATLTRDGAAEVTAWFVASLSRRLDLSAGRPIDRVAEVGAGLPS